MRSWLCFASILISFHMTQAQQNVPTSGVQINSVSADGNGCRPGTVRTSLSPDRNELSMLFDQFISESGGNTNNVTDKKNCMIDIEFEIPDGWSMSLVGSDYRGFITLDEGTVGTHQAHFMFTHSRGEKSFSAQTLKGPINQDYYFHNDLSTDSDGWSMCNARKIKMKLRVSLVTQILKANSSQKPYAQMTLDSLDSAVQQKFRVGWKACTGNGNGNNGNGRGNGNNGNNGRGRG